MKWYKKILIGLSVLGIGIAAIPAIASAATVYNAPALFETSLASAISNNATSAVLSSGILRDGTTLNGPLCLTVDSGLSNTEFMCGSASGTIISNLVRGIGEDGSTTFTGLEYAHRYGADVKITDFPYLQQILNFLQGLASFLTPLQYDPSVSTSTVAANPNNLASVGYVNSVAVSGAPNGSPLAKGIFQEATKPQLASGTAIGSTGADLVAPSGAFSAYPSMFPPSSVTDVVNTSTGSIPINTLVNYAVTAVNSGGQETTYRYTTDFMVATGSVNLSWTAVPYAVSYNIYYATSTGALFANSLSTSTKLTTFTDTGSILTVRSSPQQVINNPLSTPTTTVPVINNSGTLADGFIGQSASDSYSFAGPVSMSGITTISGTSTAPYLVPPGTIEAYVTSTAPNGWLLCNGQTVATSTYPNLFAIVGYAYGGSTSTFGLPNMGGRFISGPGSNTSSSIGATGGSTSSLISPIFTTSGQFGGGGGSGIVAFTGGGTTAIVGTTTVPIIPPYIVMQYIIKF